MANVVEKASQLHRVGSFGTPIRHGEKGDEVTEIWFCGAEGEANGHRQGRCAHRTKREAERCARGRAERSAHDEG